ncbi:hypothetical protein BDN71DRAFT_617676 [Pleurotus eryngii]|uniref:Uncharacterized protein n=1 Tax=Pleurotus eryngii TaxID=5323 RepID=A0A9P5ZHN7_PLEER|nr:hypothetical protein BDN71DRAFT_617676 [Pleurotus eryngii]
MHIQRQHAPMLCEGYRLEEQWYPQFRDLEAALQPQLPLAVVHVLSLICLGFADTVSLLQDTESRLDCPLIIDCLNSRCWGDSTSTPLVFGSHCKPHAISMHLEGRWFIGGSELHEYEL